ncbi:MAG TPA: hypothetical protein GX517_05375 [Alicyclobacillus sp.]|nr:hypothetical protein [Alicyclobacillus sp.]
MKLWTVPVFGSGVFFLIAVAAGHVWTTALLRTGVSAVVLTIVALVVEGVRRWVVEAAPSTIDLRSEPDDDDLAQLAVGGRPPGFEGEETTRAQAEGESTVPASPLPSQRPDADGAKSGQWTDLAAWVQRRR